MKKVNIIHLIFLNLILLFGAACAVIDTSVLDTAIPLKPGKIKAMTYLVSGIEQNSMIFSPTLPADEDNGRNANAGTDLGIKLGIGIAKNVELDVSSLAFSSPIGKIALKIGLGDDGRNALAIMPGAYSLRGSGPGNSSPGGSNAKFSGKYSSAGFEIPVLFTHRDSKNGRMTLCAKFGYNHLEYERTSLSYNVVDNGTYESFYTGLVANAQIKIWKIVIIPEGGFYTFQVSNGKISVVPVLNFGIGFDLGD